MKFAEYERQSAKRGRMWLLLMLCVKGEVKRILGAL